MKTFLKKILSGLLACLLASPLALYSSTAQAGCPACSQYNTAAAACKNSSQTPPSPIPGQPVITTDACSPEKFQQDWGQVGHHCSSIKASEEGQSSEMITASVYTAAAAVCAAACISMHSPIIAASSALLAACTISGGVAGATDLVNAILIGDAVSGIMGGLVGAAGVAGSLAVTGVASSSAGHKIAGSPCISMGVLLTVAGIKWYMMSDSAGNAKDACKKASKLVQGNSTDVNGGGSRLNFGSSLDSKDPLSRELGGTPNPVISNLENMDGFPRANLAAAKAGPDVFDQFPNSAQFPSALKELGMSPKHIAEQLQSQSPSAFVSGMSGMTDELKKSIGDIDSAIKNGKIQLAGAAGSYAGGSGGSGPAGAPANPFGDFSFGQKKAESEGGDSASLVKFSKTNRDLSSPGSDDIWHAGYKGSIFDIISYRLSRSSDKIQPGEWSTPLNRALMGLPAAGSPPPKPAVPRK